MARTQSATSPTLAKVSGETAQIAYGTAGGSGTTTTVTIPQFTQVISVVATSQTASNAVSVSTDTASANGGASFIVTHTNNEYFDWIAVGRARM